MVAVNYTQFRENMKSHLDLVTDGFETMVVTRKENKNVVVIAEDAYNTLLENIHVMGEKANYDWLMQSLKQYESGKAKARELIEVSDE